MGRKLLIMKVRSLLTADKISGKVEEEEKSWKSRRVVNTCKICKNGDKEQADEFLLYILR